VRERENGRDAGGVGRAYDDVRFSRRAALVGRVARTFGSGCDRVLADRRRELALDRQLTGP
jgi:hypothetical protein